MHISDTIVQAIDNLRDLVPAQLALDGLGLDFLRLLGLRDTGLFRSQLGFPGIGSARFHRIIIYILDIHS